MLTRIELGQRIAQLREQKGFKPAHVAKRLGIPHSNYSRYENGTQNFSYEFLSQMADLLGLSLDQLTGREEIIHTDPGTPLTVDSVTEFIRDLSENLQRARWTIAKSQQDFDKANTELKKIKASPILVAYEKADKIQQQWALLALTGEEGYRKRLLSLATAAQLAALKASLGELTSE